MKRWFPYGVGSDTARLRVYCFPYAGGAASVFRGWCEALGPDVSVVPIQLPGRETRLHEQPLRTVDEIVEHFERACGEHITQRPFAFLGHSFGARIAYECAMRLQRAGRLPDLLIVAGCNPVHLFDRSPRLSTLEDSRLIEDLARLKGTPAAVLQDQELLRIVLPYLRADYCASEAYEYRPRGRLQARLVALGGAEDPEVSRAELEQWKHHAKEFSCRILPGDHFFLFRNDREVRDALWSACTPTVSRCSPARPERGTVA